MEERERCWFFFCPGHHTSFITLYYINRLLQKILFVLFWRLSTSFKKPFSSRFVWSMLQYFLVLPLKSINRNKYFHFLFQSTVTSILALIYVPWFWRENQSNGKKDFHFLLQSVKLPFWVRIDTCDLALYYVETICRHRIYFYLAHNQAHIDDSIINNSFVNYIPSLAINIVLKKNNFF
jgi:hypothetical protein